jgi:hypothetical protein
LFGFGKDIVLLRVICVVRGAGVAQGLVPLNCLSLTHCAVTANTDVAIAELWNPDARYLVPRPGPAPSR